MDTLNTELLSDLLVNGYIIYYIFILVLMIIIIITFFVMANNISKIRKILEDIRVNQEEISANTNGLVTLEVKKARLKENR